MPSAGALALAAAVLAQIASPQPSNVPAPPAALPIHLALDPATLKAAPHTTLVATDEHGHTARYGGVALRDILTQAGVPAGHAVRGAEMRDVVVVDAADGYRIVFALAELDPSYTDRVVLVADSRDGTPFSGQEGPLRLVVPGEKREARWARQVIAVDVERIP
jgi:hypothetical protein